MPLHVAVDLGAGSGRAIVGGPIEHGFLLEEVHRFDCAPRPVDGHLRWDFAALRRGVREGLARAQGAARSRGGALVSVGVDSWGVDYGLLDGEGHLLEDPVCYRDDRTAGVPEEVWRTVPRDEAFARTGIQVLPFNTLYQLVAHQKAGIPAAARRLLLIPDLCHHELCGSLVTERTNASTTQMLAVDGARWDEDLVTRLGLPAGLLPEIVEPGTELGTLAPRHQAELGLDPIRVITPATHDTASAVAGTPLQPGWAYVSSGTWSLVGVERATPLASTAAARANFTNERGVGGTVRFLKNVMGLWIFESCRREWEAAGRGEDRETLLARVAALPGIEGIVYPDDPRFFHPARMTDELRACLRETGQPAPDDPARLAKVIFDSLALRYASVVATIEDLTGTAVTGLHVVGGGAKNAYLNQATADATGRPVLAGPVEATAAGNLLVQALACGEVASIDEGRRRLAKALPPVRYTPRRGAPWAEAARRYEEIAS